MDGLGPKACSLSVLLVTELVDESLQEHLPINGLRNQAVLLAQTPLVAMLDADMVVSRSLAESLADPEDAEVSSVHCMHTLAACCFAAVGTHVAPAPGSLSYQLAACTSLLGHGYS